ncbi:MAG TPA: hypothetical protein EYH34_13380 [Planctomycetes bacterium]|nr:hypothetical protein [Planctomycetota bacterium]
MGPPRTIGLGRRRCRGGGVIPGLSDEGNLQALRTGRLLAPVRLDAVYSSPLVRRRQAAMGHCKFQIENWKVQICQSADRGGVAYTANDLFFPVAGDFRSCWFGLSATDQSESCWFGMGATPGDTAPFGRILPSLNGGG